jgi:hypothetical protein
VPRSRSVVAVTSQSSVCTWTPPQSRQFAADTEPEGLFAFELGVRANDGAAEFSLVSVDIAEGNRTASAMTASIEAPVVTQVSPERTERAVARRVGEPPGHRCSGRDVVEPGAGAFTGMTLPSLEVAFERRLVPGSVQNPASARAVGGDSRLFVPAHPMADLAAL